LFGLLIINQLIINNQSTTPSKHQQLKSYTMKKLFPTCLLLLFALVESSAQAPVDWLEKNILSSFEYRCVGPTRGGRVTTVSGVPGNPSTYYMGATGGGVWKTDDYGITWKNSSDGYFETPSIGAISVSASHTDIVYVGTGSDGLRSNVITGKGVYKSTNAGKTWTHIGLRKVGQIGAVEVHPGNPDIVYVAAIGQAFQENRERGVYRTMDGGKTWQQVLHLSSKIGFADLEFAPDDPTTIYAAAWKAERKPWTIISGGDREGGIYKSTDGGETWTQLWNGLPQGLIGKIDLAVSSADANRLYALVEAPEGKGGVYSSTDRGATFQLVSTKKQLLDRPFYYCNIAADPQNANVLYAMATRFWKSIDAGKTWRRIRTPHGDDHDIWINPENSLNFIEGNDGGANITMNGGKTWSSQHNQPTSELYQVEVDDQTPYWLYAGQQDNYTTIAVPSLPPYKLQADAGIGLIVNTGGFETGPAVPKPGNPDIVYSNCKGRFGVYNKKTGQEKRYYVGASNIYGHNPKDLKFRFQRVAPVHVSPHNSDVIYHTSQYVHKTTDEGLTWEIISPDLTAFEADKQMVSGSPITRDVTGEEIYSTIYSIQESKIQQGLIWVGANDGPIQVTRNAGKDWENVTPNMPKGGRVDSVEPSVHDKGKAIVSVLRYQLGDWTPYIYRTYDYGKNWTLINKGIPNDYPVRVVREDPDRAGLLYAGTEFGLFISLDDGANWHSFQRNLPITPITDIKVHQKDLVVSTMGRSFWIMDNLSSLHESLEQVATTPAYLFQPKSVYRMRHSSTGKNSIPNYPANGAIIDYYLKEDLQTPIKLAVLNKDNKVIRSFTSMTEKESNSNTSELDMGTGFAPKGATPLLKTTSGLHRFKWDLRHEGSWDKDPSKNGKNGVLVAPEDYTIQVTINEQVYKKSLTVALDPRLEASKVTTADLLAQEALTLKIRDLQSRAKQLAYTVENQRKKIQEQEASLDRKKEVMTLRAIEDQLVTAKGRYQQPMLLAQLSYLGYMLNAADQRPGKDAYDRYEVLKEQLENLIIDVQQSSSD